MNTTTMSHTSDPETSAEAAEKLNPHDTLRLKLALIDLLADTALTADELTDVYFQVAEFRRWPRWADKHNVKRRLSTLHTIHHVIQKAGKRPSRMGRASTVWELSTSVDEARRIVGAS